MRTRAGVSAIATCRLLLRIRLVARSVLLRGRRLDADDVLDGVAGDGHDHQPDEGLRQAEAGHRRLERLDEQVRGEGRADARRRPGRRVRAAAARPARRDGSRSSTLAPRPPLERERDRGGEDDEQDDRDDDAQVDLRGRRPARRASWPGSGWPARRRPAGAASRSSGRPGAWKVWVPCRSPPMRNARPSTSRLLARIEPISAVWTTTTRPACRAKIEMNSSGRLPRADWRMPGRRRPEALAELVGPLPDQRGQGGQGDGADDEDDRLAGAQAVEHERERRAVAIATTATTLAVRPRIEGRARSVFTDRRCPGRSPGHPTEARRARRAAGAAGRSPPRPGVRRRRARPRPRRAPRPRPGPRSAPRPRPRRRPGAPPRQSPTTIANSPRAGMSPPGAGGLGQLAERAPDDRLVELGQLAADGPRPVRPARLGEVAQGRRDAARRLVQDRPALVGRDPGQPLAPLAPGARQEPLERPARPGHPRCGDRGQDRRRARDRHDPAALARPRPPPARRPGR